MSAKRRPLLGETIAGAQDIVPCWVEPFLHSKRIAEIGKQSLINYNWGFAYANGIHAVLYNI
jgi:hypothetical protein